MTLSKVSRRDAFKTAFGGLAIAGLGGSAAQARSGGEIEAMESLIGRQYDVRGGEALARVELEAVVPMGEPVRPPFSAPGRAPFVAVFRQLGGDDLTDGTYTFQGALTASVDLMVQHYRAKDGTVHLEAVFN